MTCRKHTRQLVCPTKYLDRTISCQRSNNPTELVVTSDGYSELEIKLEEMPNRAALKKP